MTRRSTKALAKRPRVSPTATGVTIKPRDPSEWWNPATHTTKRAKTVEIVSKPWGGPAYMVVDADETAAWTNTFTWHAIWKDVVVIGHDNDPRGNPWAPARVGSSRINLPFVIALTLEELARHDMFDPLVLSELLKTWNSDALQTAQDLGGYEGLWRVVRAWLKTADVGPAARAQRRLAAAIIHPNAITPELPERGLPPIVTGSPTAWRGGLDFATTGRTSSAHPNPQNIRLLPGTPRHLYPHHYPTEVARSIRANGHYPFIEGRKVDATIIDDAARGPAATPIVVGDYRALELYLLGKTGKP